MSSTNHTTNYNLPQFVGSDKPAWLGDINPAMSAIDSAMHTNATKAQQGIDDALTAKNRADSAYSLADGAKTDAGTAQGTANQAIANASAVDSKLDAFMQKFNLVSFTDSPATATSGVIVNNLTLAQNSDGSIFKFYGHLQLNTGATMARSAIAGMSGWYGVDTGLVLNTSPTEAYMVKGAGVASFITATLANTDSTQIDYFAVGTNGHIYVVPAQSSANLTTKTNASYDRYIYIASLYFNTSFGDAPEA